jgi:hypothetical protein
MKSLLRRSSGATNIRAHLGLGRVVYPVQPSASAPATERDLNQGVIVEGILEVAKYVLADTVVLRRSADIINRHPDRFLFGSDVVAPRDSAQYYAVFDAYAPLWERANVP